MEETRRRLGPRAVLGVIAVVLAAAALWATAALAAGGPTSSERGTGVTTGATTVQSESDAPDRDCPNRDGESGQSSDI